jgi:hypothetical protein
LAAGNSEEAERLYNAALANSIPIPKLREAIDDLSELVQTFPDITEARNILGLLFEAVNKMA